MSENMNFKVVIDRDEDGFFIATVPALPGCVSQGKTEKEALKNIKEAISLHIGCLAQDGVPITKGRSGKEVMVAVSV
jgi:predicted RNase H-like HicB family nuclease